MNLKNRAVINLAPAVLVIVILCLAGVAAAQEATTAAGASATAAARAFTDPAVPAPTTDSPSVAYFSAATPPTTTNNVESPEGWRFTLSLPVWLPGLNGDVTAKGFTFTANQDTGDVLDAIDSHLNAALSLHLEAQKDKLGVFTDFMYVSVGAEQQTRLDTTVKEDVEGYIGELGALYTVYSTERVGGHGPPLRLDALGGLRVTSLRVSVDPENFRSAEQSKTILDPFIGLRGEVGLLHWLSFKGRGDVGGFDMIDGQSCQLTWNASAAASFQPARWCYIDAGYRWLDYDFEDGSGRDRYALDATLHGPFIELAFKF